MVSQLVKKFSFHLSIFIFPSQRSIGAPALLTNSPSVKPFRARRIEINTIHIIFSVRHSIALLCFVKQPRFVLKAIGCNLVPHITDFPSAIFHLGESDIPEHFLMLPLLIFMFLSSGRERQKHNQRETYFIVSKNFSCVFEQFLLLWNLRLFSCSKRKISIQDRRNPESFSKLFPTTSPSFRQDFSWRHIQAVAGFKHRTVQPVAHSIHSQR